MAKSGVSALKARVIALATIFALCGCAPQSSGIADPIQRNFQWFSYVGGDDIRSSCSPASSAAPARYRLVYNAIWSEQVRAYDLERLPAGQGAMLKVHAISGAPRVLQSYVFGSPSSAGTVIADTRLTENQYLELVRAIEAAGFGRMPPDNTRLQSWDFYWIANACAGGRWHLNAWRRDDPEFVRLGFDRLLFGHDRTGIPVNPPRDPRRDLRNQPYNEAPNERAAATDNFELLIRGGRLAGNLRLF